MKTTNRMCAADVVGRYKLTQDLRDRVLEFEQTVEFSSDENKLLSEISSLDA